MRTMTRPAALKVAMRERRVDGAEHGILRVEHEVEDDLLELALVAVDAREAAGRSSVSTRICAVLNWWSSRVSGVAEELVEVDAGELGAAGAGEVEQAVDDLGGAEGLLGDLFEHGREALVVAHVLGEHLGVAGDDGERRVDLVRDAGGEQADGRELLGLGELGFELDAVGDVVDQDDAADGDEVAGDQRRDGDVGGADFAGGERRGGTCRGCGCPASSRTLLKRAMKSGGKTAESGWRRASARGWAYMTSICAFQLSMRSSRSTAKTPMLMDSTMFSLNSLRRSNSVILRSRRR